MLIHNIQIMAKFEENCMNVLFVAAAIFALYYVMKHCQLEEGFATTQQAQATKKAVAAKAVHAAMAAAQAAAPVPDIVPSSVNPGEQLGRNEVYASVSKQDGLYGLTEGQVPADCYPKDELEPDDLLPRNAATQFAQENPASGTIGDQNFLDAGYHIGVNTVGQSLRNANVQLRSEPPNPQVKVSPWLQTTINPDTNRRPLEIGGCA